LSGFAGSLIGKQKIYRAVTLILSLIFFAFAVLGH
jgi:hypothetical protein